MIYKVGEISGGHVKQKNGSTTEVNNHKNSNGSNGVHKNDSSSAPAGFIPGVADSDDMKKQQQRVDKK